MLSNYARWAELAQQGMQVPPSMLIDLDPGLTQEQKAKYNAMISSQAQAEQQQEDKKYNTELIKTIIANQAKLQQQQGKQTGEK